MISRSVEQVEQGSMLVDQAGQTMGEIVGSIQKVSDIVAEITSATVEQSSGVQQVAQSVSQMDLATQQNAALVEESAAAAESLRNQAQELVQAVAVFRIPGGTSTKPSLATVKRVVHSSASPKAAFKPKPAPGAATARKAPAASQVDQGSDDWTDF